MKYLVRILKQDTKEVVEEFTPTTERQAERLEDGVNINLNHTEYCTELVEVDDNYTRSVQVTTP
jgi:hypothetical protein